VDQKATFVDQKYKMTKKLREVILRHPDVHVNASKEEQEFAARRFRYAF